MIDETAIGLVGKCAWSTIPHSADSNLAPNLHVEHEFKNNCSDRYLLLEEKLDFMFDESPEILLT